MRELCEMIKKQTDANFINLITAIRTYDRDAMVCGAPAWRYVYHTIHSADRWYINPYVYEEPEFHEEGLNDPNRPCSTVLSDGQLLAYLERVRRKTAEYIDTLTDDMLSGYPENCDMTRLELVLRQFRHISTHIGMLNGLTAEKTGRLPVYITPDTLERLDKGLYEN